MGSDRLGSPIPLSAVAGGRPAKSRGALGCRAVVLSIATPRRGAYAWNDKALCGDLGALGGLGGGKPLESFHLIFDLGTVLDLNILGVDGHWNFLADA